MLIPIDALVVRERPDPAKVARYRAMLREGSTPPPIAVMPYDGRRFCLLDSHHRLQAARCGEVPTRRGDGRELAR